MKTRILCVLVVAFLALVACGSDPGETSSAAADLSVPVSEQDISAARQSFDAGRELWDSFEPFAYTMSIGVETVSEVRIAFDADGNVLSEEITRGDPDGGDTDRLPRSVDDVFAAVESLIVAFETGTSPVPDEGECGRHLNARFDAEWGVPARYDSLGPCDDGVGVVISITPS